MANVPMTDEQITRPHDRNISRNRGARFLILIIYSIAVPLVGLLCGLMLGSIFFGPGMMHNLTWITGLFGGLVVVASTIEQFFIIRNDTTGMFVTQDQLNSFLGKENDVNVYYGPGTHISYPWEARSADGNISLQEAANEITFTVQCADGVINGRASYRLRPDMTNPVAFLTGVAAMADEIKDLIVKEILLQLQEKNVRDALKMVKFLNDILEHEFKSGHTDLERRFGIHFGDVTVSELLPSEEVQRTMSALMEAEVVFQGTAMMLGYPDVADARQALKDGKITEAAWKDARDRFLSISGNLEGMEIKRTEIEIGFHGLAPETIEALAKLAQTPAAQAAASRLATLTPKTKKGKK